MAVCLWAATMDWGLEFPDSFARHSLSYVSYLVRRLRSANLPKWWSNIHVCPCPPTYDWCCCVVYDFKQFVVMHFFLISNGGSMSFGPISLEAAGKCQSQGPCAYRRWWGAGVDMKPMFWPNVPPLSFLHEISTSLVLLVLNEMEMI